MKNVCHEPSVLGILRIPAEAARSKFFPKEITERLNKGTCNGYETGCFSFLFESSQRDGMKVSLKASRKTWRFLCWIKLSITPQ